MLSALSAKKKRSTTLLRSLAFNIGRCTDKMNIKQCADVLYALAVLNFPDEVLLEKVGADLQIDLHTNERPSVIGSILTSIGILRYRDPGIFMIQIHFFYTWVNNKIEINVV